MRALMELVERGPQIVRTDDLARAVAPDVLAAARRAGIVRPEDRGFEDISASDLSRVLRVLYGLTGRGRPVPTVFDAAAAPLGWAGTDKSAREVLFCARPESGLAKALARKKAALVLVPTARPLTPALRERHGPGALVELEALEEALVALGGRLVRKASIAPDAPDAGAPAVEVLPPTIRLVGLAKRSTDVRFHRLDETSVRIRAGGRSIKCTHVDLGMAHGETRVPTRAWEVLWELCEHGGFFRTRRLGGAEATRQTIHRFSNDLQALFGIRGSCFHRYRGDCGWRSRFQARRDGSDSDDDE